jgi:hypothetical protein
MSIYHDIYLFEPKRFVSTIKPYLASLTKGSEGYYPLKSHVEALLDDNTHVKKLASEYGGWDKDSVLATISPTNPYSSEDLGCLITFLLYEQLIQLPSRHLGLGHNFASMERILGHLNWGKDNINWLVMGKSFREFAKSWSLEESNVATSERKTSYWDFISPNSTLGHIGWIAADNISTFLDQLISDEPKLDNLLYLKEAHVDTKRVYSLAKEMLRVAKEANSDLCIIISG